MMRRSRPEDYNFDLLGLNLDELNIVKDNPEKSLRDIVRFLASNDPGVRIAAIDAAQEFDRTSSFEYILPHIFDEDVSVKVVAIEHVGSMSFMSASVHLARILLYDTHELPRICAAEALSYIEDASKFIIDALLVSLTNDKSVLVRSYSAEAIGRLGAVDRLDVLRMQFPNEGSTRVRASLLDAMTRLGDKSAPARLLKMVKRMRNGDVKDAAVRIVIDISSIVTDQDTRHEYSNFLDNIS